MSGSVSDIPVIVLAAGGSTRMRGADKLLEDVDGEPLVRRQARIARAVTTGQVLVALPPKPHSRYAALDGLDVTPLEVRAAAEGMNASLRTAFGALPPHAAAAMLVLGDMPDLTENDLRCVLHQIDLKEETLIWRGVTESNRPGHPIVFAAALFPRFADLKGDGGGREVVAAAQGRISLIPLPGDRARLDLDTPEDWAMWRAQRQST
ncbi:NTP transferase domain-containing protein [Thalassococcus sp. S3]|uniref:nucleotidyltransferase family protein n=1 Tax=Thalassococcus sp. S3 TaxID=2017482 RepID=UPI001024868A|nr:nucleotidyltransferase family protein [Thalassococcus sp. S3]QBF31657.1 4-diphosphocytidyl-2C-methyl-D-erythritol synthase [Thalassococcus sp. S3]